MKKLLALSLLFGLLTGLAPLNSNSNYFKNVLVNFERTRLRNQLKPMVEISPRLFLSKYEVSNKEYKEFVHDLADHCNLKQLEKCLPDTSVWHRFAYNDPYAQFYFQHEAFSNYPVLGISFEAAQAFCAWKTEKTRVTEVIDKQGRTSEPKIIFRLPSEEEWEKAAKAGNDQAVFAGGWEKLVGKKDRFAFNHQIRKGKYTDWYMKEPDTLTGEKGKDMYIITGPVNNKYFPIDKKYGLYNIAGNIAEMVSEKGIAKGGSWFHYADEAKIGHDMNYQQPEAWLGFRYVAEIVSP